MTDHVLLNADGSLLFEVVGTDYVASVAPRARFMESASEVEATMIAGAGTATLSLVTAGFSLPGDRGGARYVFSATEPAFGGIQSLDGAWWALSELLATPEMFGAQPTPIDPVTGPPKDNGSQANCGPAINAAIQYLNAIGGGELKFGPHLYATSEPILLSRVDGVCLSGTNLSQFAEDAGTVIGAKSNFAVVAGGVATAGKAVIDIVGDAVGAGADTAARNNRIENLRVEGTSRNKAVPMDNTPTGVGEHGIRLFRTGTTRLVDVTSQFCDGATLVLDGAWQTWVRGGYFKNCRQGVLLTSTAGRKCSQTWFYAPNIQRNRTFNIKFANTSSDPNGDLLAATGFKMEGGIVEFSYSATVDTNPLEYDPGFVAQVVCEAALQAEFSKVHFAQASAADVATPVFMLGVEAGDATVTGFALHGGMVQSNAAQSAIKFAGPRVHAPKFIGVQFNLLNNKNIVDFNGPLPVGAITFADCAAWQVNKGERFRPLSHLDVVTSTLANRALANFSCSAGAFGRVDVGALTVPASGTATATVGVVGAKTTDVVLHFRYETNEYDSIDYSAVTTTAIVLRPGLVQVTYANATGADIELPAGTLAARAMPRPDLAREFRNIRANYNPPSIASGAMASTTVTVSGAALGDQVQVAPTVDIGALIVSAKVTSANTVTIYLANLSGASIDPPASDYLVRVERQ